MKQSLSDTITAIATPQGQGALGIVRISGEKALSIADTIFKGKQLSAQPSHTLHFGTIRNDDKVIDEVVVSLFKSPNSYTGEDLVEISCHGSSYILQEVLQLILDSGARLAEPGEFTKRAFLNGKMDLSQAEAVADLIASSSAASHDLAMKQMRGGFSSEIKKLREELVHFASMVELELDFSEEDVEFADRDQLVELINKLKVVIRQLIHSFKLGNVLKNGVATVIAGRPNAGKSTLLNALLKEERAIVSDIPGTTRDTIEELINIDGIIFRLIDTAGIRNATDKIETIGVGKTMEQIKRSTLVVYLFDLSEMEPKDLEADLEKLGVEVPVILIGNKMDLVGQDVMDRYLEIDKRILFISSLESDNLESINKALLEKLNAQNWEAESTIVTSARHYHALQLADEALDRSLEGVEMGVSGELLAVDIRTALDALGEITGEITTEDLLGNIFSKFCIGK